MSIHDSAEDSDTAEETFERQHLAGDLLIRQQSITLPDIPDEGLLIRKLFVGILPKHVSSSDTQPRKRLGCDDYEICGKVLGIGHQAVAACPLKEGDIVIIYPWTGCGCCEVCTSGNSHLCEDSSDTTDERKFTSSTHRMLPIYHIVQDWKSVVRLPREIPAQIGCLLPYSALRIYSAILEVRPALELAVRLRGFANLLIIGSNDLSELWAIILMKNVFCDKNVKVICAVRKQTRLDQALSTGADDTVLWNDSATVDEMINAATMSNCNKMDAVIDLVADESTISTAVRSLHYGGTVLLLGSGDSGDQSTTIMLPLPLMLRRSLTVKAVSAASRTLLKQLIDLVSVLDSAAVCIPVEYYRPDELSAVQEKLRKDEMKGRAIIRYSAEPGSESCDVIGQY